VEFYLSTNPGEPLKPLSLVASGGEVSRIMLAIKTVFEKIDPAKTLVFDEIDSGISGLAATKVASHLVELSKHKQVLCITHLAQIASQADHHLHIDKYTENHNTYVNFKYVTKKDRTNIMNKLFLGTSNGELDG
jgi:DNA repair protein RecN (Recombination protein N)